MPKKRQSTRFYRPQLEQLEARHLLATWYFEGAVTRIDPLVAPGEYPPSIGLGDPVTGTFEVNGHYAYPDINGAPDLSLISDLEFAIDGVEIEAPSLRTTIFDFFPSDLIVITGDASSPPGYISPATEFTPVATFVLADSDGDILPPLGGLDWPVEMSAEDWELIVLAWQGGSAPDSWVVMEITKIEPLARDLQTTFLDWDDTNGGVDVQYKISGSDLDEAPKFKFYWASGDSLANVIKEIPGFKTGVKEARDLPYPLDVGADFFSAPPEGATHLLVKVDFDKKIEETDESESSNVKAIAYSPSVKLVDVKYDGDDNHTRIGRFFTGVDVNDQSFTVKLSESLDALRPVLRLFIAGKELFTTRIDERTYKTELYNDTANLDADTAVTVAVRKDGDSLDLPSIDVTTIDMEPLPQWIEKLKPNKEFRSSDETYYFTGVQLSPASVSLPALSTGLSWLDSQLAGTATQAGISAVVDVVAPLAVAIEPHATGRSLNVFANVIGNPVLNKTYTPGFPVDATLDAKSLELTGLSVALPAPASTGNITLWQKQITIPILTATKPLLEVTLELGFELIGILTVDSAGLKVTWDDDDGLIYDPTGTFFQVTASATGNFTGTATAEFISGWFVVEASAFGTASFALSGKASFSGLVSDPTVKEASLVGTLQGSYGYSLTASKGNKEKTIEKKKEDFGETASFGPYTLFELSITDPDTDPEQ